MQLTASTRVLPQTQALADTSKCDVSAGSYNKAYTSAATWTGKECKIQEQLGKGSVQLIGGANYTVRNITQYHIIIDTNIHRWTHSVYCNRVIHCSCCMSPLLSSNLIVIPGESFRWRSRSQCS